MRNTQQFNYCLMKSVPLCAFSLPNNEVSGVWWANISQYAKERNMIKLYVKKYFHSFLWELLSFHASFNTLGEKNLLLLTTLTDWSQGLFLNLHCIPLSFKTVSLLKMGCDGMCTYPQNSESYDCRTALCSCSAQCNEFQSSLWSEVRQRWHHCKAK